MPRRSAGISEALLCRVLKVLDYAIDFGATSVWIQQQIRGDCRRLPSLQRDQSGPEEGVASQKPRALQVGTVQRKLHSGAPMFALEAPDAGRVTTLLATGAPKADSPLVVGNMRCRA